MRNVYVELDYNDGSDKTRTFSIYSDGTGEGRLLAPLKFSVKVRTWIQADRTESSISKISICNADGELDDFIENTFTACRIKENDNGTTSTLATGLIDRVVLTNNSVIEVSLKDASRVLDIPLQDEYFPASETSDTGSGTNTYYALEGQPRPLALGDVLSVKPVLAKRSNNEYHCSEQSLDATVTTYDRGVVVTHTDQDKGFTLNADPDGAVVADIEASDSVGIFTRYSILNLDEDDLDYIDNNKGYDYAYYQDNTSSSTIFDFLTWFCDSITGWFYADEVGDIRFGYLELPAVTADVEINTTLSEVKVFDDLAPNLTTKLGYDRNWYVYEDDQIAASATAENRANLTKQWRGTLDGVNKVDDFYSPLPTIHDTFIRGESNGQDEIDNITELYSERRRFYTFDSPEIAEIGQTVKLTYPRFGLETGVNLFCVGYEIDFIYNSYRLTLWG